MSQMWLECESLEILRNISLGHLEYKRDVRTISKFRKLWHVCQLDRLKMSSAVVRTKMSDFAGGTYYACDVTHFH